jgi:hypothetical protein
MVIVPYSANSATGTVNGMVPIKVLPKTFKYCGIPYASVPQTVGHNLLGSLSSHELLKIFHNCTDTQVPQVSNSRSFNIDVLQNVAAIDKTTFSDIVHDCTPIFFSLL